jgi:hypothetical protein
MLMAKKPSTPKKPPVRLKRTPTKELTRKKIEELREKRRRKDLDPYSDMFNCEPSNAQKSYVTPDILKFDKYLGQLKPEVGEMLGGARGLTFGKTDVLRCMEAGQWFFLPDNRKFMVTMRDKASKLTAEGLWKMVKAKPFTDKPLGYALICLKNKKPNKKRVAQKIGFTKLEDLVL